MINKGLHRCGDDPEAKLKVIEEVIEVIKTVEDPLKKSLLASHAAEKFGVREDALWEKLTRYNKKRPQRTISHFNFKAAKPVSGARKREESVLGFILAYPEYFDAFMELGLDFWLKDASLQKLWSIMLSLYSSEGRFDKNLLLQQLEDEKRLKKTAEDLAKVYPQGDSPEDILKELKLYCEKRRKETLRQHLLEEIRDASEKERQQLLIQIQQLH